MVFYPDDVENLRGLQNQQTLSDMEKTMCSLSGRLHFDRMASNRYEQSHHQHNDYVDDLNYAIDALNSSKRFNLLLRGGVFGSLGHLWSDLNDACRSDFNDRSDINDICSDYNNTINDDLANEPGRNPAMMIGTSSTMKPHLPGKMSSISIPKSLQTQMSFVSMHIAMGMLPDPVDRVWVAIDDHLFIWNTEDDDVAFIDLQCIALHVDILRVPNEARNPKHVDIEYFLVVASTNRIKVFELKLFPTVSVVFDSDDKMDAAMYEHKPHSDQMISACCVTPIQYCTDENQGCIFYGTRDGRVFQLMLNYSSFWGCTCKSVELSGFGPGLLRSVLSPIFFSNALTGNTSSTASTGVQRQVDQLCATSRSLLVRRSNQIQCGDLKPTSWSSFSSLTNVQAMQIQAISAIFLPEHVASTVYFGGSVATPPSQYILIITDHGSRLIVDSSTMQILAHYDANVGICSNAFVDPETGLCLVQRREDGLILHTDSRGNYQPVIDQGTLWAFRRFQPVSSKNSAITSTLHNVGLGHSRLARPSMEFLLLTTNHCYSWRIDAAKEFPVESMSNLEVVVALADLLHPFWNKPLAKLVNVENQDFADQNMLPVVSVLDSHTCHELKSLLEKLEAGVVPAHANDLCHLIGDVFGCWHLLSVEHQLHAITAHIAEKHKSDLLRAPLYEICSPKGQPLITALLNGLIQLYLDDRAATDALLARLKLVSPKFFSSDAVLLAQASELLQRSAECQDNGRYVVDRRNVWAKEALNLLIRAASSVDLELWAPSLLKLGLFKELVSLTIMIATNYVDPKGSGLVYYVNALTPEDDVYGFQIMKKRFKLYNIMLNAASKSNEHLQAVEDYLLSSQEDQLAHVALFDRCMNKYILQGSNDTSSHLSSGKVSYGQSSMVVDQVELKNRFSDVILLKLNKSNYFENYLRFHSSGSVDQFETCNFALRSLCRLYELKGNNLQASDSLVQLATSTTHHQIDIGERISLLDQALLNIRSCLASSSTGSTTKTHRFPYQQQDHINVRIMDIENFLEVGRLQQKIAERIEDEQRKYGTSNTMNINRDVLASVNKDLRELRHTGGLIDLTRLFKCFAEPYELYDCQLAILSMASHPDHELISELWDKICKTDIDSVVNGEGNVSGELHNSAVLNTLSTLRFTNRSIDNGCIANARDGGMDIVNNHNSYIPIDLIVRTLESITQLDDMKNSKASPVLPGWSIRLLSKCMKMSLIVCQIQDLLTNERVDLLEPLFDVIISNGGDDVETVKILIKIITTIIEKLNDENTMLLQRGSGSMNGDDSVKSSESKQIEAGKQKMQIMLRALERKKQNMLFF